MKSEAVDWSNEESIVKFNQYNFTRYRKLVKSSGDFELRGPNAFFIDPVTLKLHVRVLADLGFINYWPITVRYEGDGLFCVLDDFISGLLPWQLGFSIKEEKELDQDILSRIREEYEEDEAPIKDLRCYVYDGIAIPPGNGEWAGVPEAYLDYGYYYGGECIPYFSAFGALSEKVVHWILAKHKGFIEYKPGRP